jgi:hypothetical protein
MKPIQTILSLTHGWNLPRDKKDAEKLISAYYELSPAEGKRLADSILHSKDEKTCEIILRNLSLLVPGSLEGHYPEIIERRFFDWYEYFRYAEPDVREMIIKRIRSENEPKMKRELIYALAWIGDIPAKKELAAMADQNVDWGSPEADKLAPTISHLIPMAGWELTEKGERRDLYLPTAYGLDLIDREPAMVSRESCPWCGTELTPTFEFELADERTKEIGLDGEKIVLGMCTRCVQYGTIFTEVDAKGAFRWSPHNVKPSNLPAAFPDPDDIGAFWSAIRTRIGKQRRSPYERVAWLPTGSECFGGFPDWVQWPEYPVCPSCKRRMVYLAQVDYSSTGDASGVAYAFLCKECLMGAVSMQCD